MATITEADANNILKVADYKNMRVGSSVVLFRAGDEWQKVETYDAFYVEVLCKLTKNLTGPTFAVIGNVGTFRVRTGPGAKSPVEEFDAQFLSATAAVEAAPLYAGANAKVSLAGGNVSVFDFNLGVGVSTGVGIKDDSLNLKLAGCGIKLGRKVGISAFDNEFGVDFGRCSVM